MQVFGNVLDLIGSTPLIKLRRASEVTGCTILGKCEFLNPGQSVKDRAALFIIQNAIRRGELRPGGVVVDGTAGNTGIGLAMVANALGMRTIIVTPETQTKEDTLRSLGADLSSFHRFRTRKRERCSPADGHPTCPICAELRNLAARRRSRSSSSLRLSDRVGRRGSPPKYRDDWMIYPYSLVEN
jgi:hypothetical protein